MVVLYYFNHCGLICFISDEPFSLHYFCCNFVLGKLQLFFQMNVIICLEILHPHTQKASTESFYLEYFSLSPPIATTSLFFLRMLLATFGEISYTHCIFPLRVPSCLFFLAVFVIVTLSKGFIKGLDIL